MKNYLPIVVTIVFVLTLAACGGEIAPGRSAEPAGEPLAGLTFATVEPRLITGREAFVGTVESSDRGELSAQINGRVGRILVREGDAVQAGALLLTIEQSAAEERLAEAEGGERAAAAQLDLAEKTLERYRQLRAGGAISQQEYDRVAAEREAAAQQLAALTAQVGQARTSLSYTRVTAPYAGRVVQRRVEVGSTVLPGTPLLAIDRDGERQARLEVPESWLGRIKPGETMSVEIPALRRTFAGTVREVIPAADPHSRSATVKVALVDAAGVSAGLFVRAARPGDGEETLLIPAAAVSERGQLSGVFVVESQRLRYRLVTIGRQLGNEVEILSGLDRGEKIVVSGVNRAVNGAAVRE